MQEVTKSPNVSDLGTVLIEEIRPSPSITLAIASLLKKTANGDRIKLDEESISRLGEMVTPFIEAELIRQKDAFIKKYQIDISQGQGKISLNLGNTKYIEFLRTAQELSCGLYNKRAVSDVFNTWESDERFNICPSDPIVIDRTLRRVEMSASSSSPFSLQELVVAHSAYLIASSGDDMFSIDGKHCCIHIPREGFLKYLTHTFSTDAVLGLRLVPGDYNPPFASYC